MAFNFEATQYGTVNVMQDGKTIATTTPQLAQTQYGYAPQNVAAGGLQNSPNLPTPAPNSTISGSASVILGMNTTKAMTSAGSTVANPPVQAPITTPGGFQAAPGTPTPGAPITATAGTNIGAFTTTQQGTNVAITDPSTGKVIQTVPQGAQITPEFQNSLALVAPAKQNLGTGYGMNVQPDGSIALTDPSGATLNQYKPTGDPQIDSARVDAMVGAAGAHQTAVKSIQDTQTAQVQDLTTQYNQQVTEIERQRQAALGSAQATFGGADAATSTADTSYINAINKQFDLTKQQAKDSFDAAVNTAKSTGEANIASAVGNFNATMASADANAQSAATQRSQYAQGQQQQAQQFAATQALSTLAKLNIPSSTLTGLKIDPATGSTGNPAVDAVVKQFVAAGNTPEQALALTQAGSLAQSKQTQSDWLNLMKNTPLPDMTNMTLADAQKDPYLSQLISQGSQVLGSPEAAFGFLKQGSITSAKVLEIQAQTAKANIEAALAPEKIANMTLNQAINEVTKLQTDNFKTGSWGATLNAIVQWMPNIESAYKSGGKGVSALTMIDALVKIDTGGQAIRQGQTNLLQESGTWGDAASRFMSSLGWGTNVGANTQLTPAQVQQVYDLAHQTAAEKITSVMPAYQTYKQGLDTLKMAYPQAVAEIDSATAQNQQIDQFIQRYSTDSTGGGGSFSLGSAGTQSYAVGNTTYVQGSDGLYYAQ